MSALKRSHAPQQRQDRPKDPAELPASKRLKSSHAGSGSTFASIIGGTNRRKVKAVTTNGVRSRSANTVDESQAKIFTGVNGNYDDDSSEEDEQVAASANEKEPDANGQTDVEMTNGVDHDEDEEEPSFGEMLKSRHPDVIDINTDQSTAAQVPGNELSSISGHSLVTVLRQALKTNDKALMETCFATTDILTIRNTIQRLPSPLVGTLLVRISEKMYRRPGRTGTFMNWIQWSLVAHGGYLATQPEVVKKLKGLNQIVRQRAQGLQPLIQLKGKLDLLAAQLELRRQVEDQRKHIDTSIDDDAVLYVEGQADDDWSADLDNQDDREEPLAIEDGDIDDDLSDDEGADLLDLEADESDEEEDDDSDDDGESDLGSVEDDSDASEEGESDAEDAGVKPVKLNRKR